MERPSRTQTWPPAAEPDLASGSGAASRALAERQRSLDAPHVVKRPVLIVLHQEHSTPGRVGRLLTERGHALDIRRPRLGDELPETLELHAGAVVFGGPMSANDPDDWLKRETDWLAVPLKEDKPLLGLCLGAQMMVNHLGGRVGTHADGRAEIGYYPIRPTAEGLALAEEAQAPWPPYVYQWHRDGFECPNGAVLLAEGDDFPVQAIRIGSCAYGVQFHPEVTHAMVYRWTTRGAERLTLPGAQPPAMHHQGRFMHDAAVGLWLGQFLDHWLAQDETRTSGPARARRATSS